MQPPKDGDGHFRGRSRLQAHNKPPTTTANDPDVPTYAGTARANEAPVRRSASGQWVAGQSGNQAGRPTGYKGFNKEFRNWARGKVDREGKKQLMDLATKAKDEKTRLYAWRLLCEYGYGKPVETVETPVPIRLIVTKVSANGEPDY